MCLAGEYGQGKSVYSQAELNANIVTISAKELRETFELIGRKENGKVEVYRHRETGEIRYVGRPYQPVLPKWWQFWKKPGELVVDGQNHDQIFKAAWDLIQPYIEWQLTDAPLNPTVQKQLRKALEMLNRIQQFDPGNWAALWAMGIAHKCLKELGSAYTAFQRAYALEKENPDVGRELAGVCIALGRGEEAVRVSREVMDKNPKDAGLISNHAFALMIAGHVQEAEAIIENALGLQPEDQITENLAKFIKAVRTNQITRPDRWPRS